jgi:hypothetical protein
MFDKKDSDRLRAWVDFRNTLETSDNPIQDTINFYNAAPLVSIQIDPYNRDTWLDPWQLLAENRYCNFAILLGIFYTLQLTTRFSNAPAEIHIRTNKETSEVLYLLFINDIAIGFDRQHAVNSKDIPISYTVEIKYTLN